MTAPNIIHAWPHSEDGWGYGTCSDKLTGPSTGAEYVRRTPAALAADPMVQAMVGSAYCDIAGSVFPWSIAAAEEIEALTPDSASAALEAMLAQARADGRKAGLEEAGQMAIAVQLAAEAMYRRPNAAPVGSWDHDRWLQAASTAETIAAALSARAEEGK